MITIDFSKRQNQTLCEFIYSSIKNQIIHGILKPDEKLPSKRNLSEHLGVSVITVQNAYSLLISEGYLYSLEKKGFFVSDILISSELNSKTNENSKFIKSQNEEFFFQKENSQNSNEEWFSDFTSNSTNEKKFPFGEWAKITRKILSSSDQKLLSKIQAEGCIELRKAISKYLLDFRNMNVNPSQIIIGSGTENLYTIIVQLLGRNLKYAVENPGYKKAARMFELNGAQFVPVSTDEHGIKIQDLQKSGANIIHLSPSHHFPTGIVMPVRRRNEILNWALEKSQNQKRYIIEDDYDSEFRFNGKPLQTLQSSDLSESVIYMNTFSKTLSPSFRISYMVLPEHLLNLFQKKMGFYSCPVSAIEQQVLALFISEGFFEKHIIRMKNYYRSIRNDLINSLEQSSISKIAKITEEESGLHFLLNVKTSKTENQIKDDLKSQKIKIASLSDFYYDKTEKTNVFVMNYSSIKKSRISETTIRLEKGILQ